MDCSMPGSSVLHCLPEFTQTHVPWFSDAIQPSHFLSPSPPAVSLSQHQGLFQWGSSLHQVAKVNRSALTRTWLVVSFPGGSVGKNLLAKAGDTVQSLGREDPLKEEVATHSTTLASEIHGQRSLVGYSPWGSLKCQTRWSMHAGTSNGNYTY